MFNLTKPPCFNLSSVDKFEIIFVESGSVQAVLQVNIRINRCG